MNTGQQKHSRVMHGMSKTKIYKSYLCMMYRCYNKNHKAYKYYGGRPENPITVCERWHDITKFFEDAKLMEGYDPTSKDISLERIDINGNYCLENCKWIPKALQQRNKSNNRFVEWKGNRITLAELAEVNGVGYRFLTGAYYSNSEKGIEYVVAKAKHNQERENLAEIARKNNVPYNKLYHQHITRGLPIEDAIIRARELYLSQTHQELGIAGIGAAQATVTGKVADSAKIGRNASTIAVIQDKTPEEIEADGPECGNKKLRIVLNRNGAQMAPDEYIDLNFCGNLISYEEARQHIPGVPY